MQERWGGSRDLGLPQNSLRIKRGVTPGRWIFRYLSILGFVTNLQCKKLSNTASNSAISNPTWDKMYLQVTISRSCIEMINTKNSTIDHSSWVAGRSKVPSETTFHLLKMKGKGCKYVMLTNTKQFWWCYNSFSKVEKLWNINKLTNTKQWQI